MGDDEVDFVPVDQPDDELGTGEGVCFDCGGTGELDGEICESCDGTGILIEQTDD